MREVALGDLCSLIVDSEHNTAPKDPAGLHPLIRTTDLGEARADLGKAQRVNSATHAVWTRRAVPTAGDLILAREAPVGGIFQVPTGVEPVLGQRTVLLRPEATRVNSTFLMYRLAARDLQARMAEMSTGSTVPHLNMADIRTFPMPQLPSLSTQRRIAAILSAFDELMEINERRIELLEDLARSLYREWFVHFRVPGHDGVELVDSELGPIPAAWAVRRLDTLAMLHRRSTKPADEPGTIFEHFSIPAFDSGALPVLGPGAAIKSAKYRVEAESVLLSKINPRIPRVWFTQPSSVAIASTEFLIWVGVEVSNAWLWCLFLDETFRGTLVGSAGGTSTSHQRIKAEDVAGRSVVVAPPTVLEAFDSLADPALQQAASIREQNRQLAATRDLLLPRLVSGRLDISDIDLGVLTPTKAE